MTLLGTEEQAAATALLPASPASMILHFLALLLQGLLLLVQKARLLRKTINLETPLVPLRKIHAQQSVGVLRHGPFHLPRAPVEALVAPPDLVVDIHDRESTALQGRGLLGKGSVVLRQLQILLGKRLEVLQLCVDAGVELQAELLEGRVFHKGRGGRLLQGRLKPPHIVNQCRGGDGNSLHDALHRLDERLQFVLRHGVLVHDGVPELVDALHVGFPKIANPPRGRHVAGKGAHLQELENRLDVPLRRRQRGLVVIFA
mmetsp:Transcript_4462/g.17562  ORF Transcript_4462/g.17562 Transcript_4462/m.17562 type:complete len:259 (+) Transcript_4462:798-1574(+)